MEPTKQDKKHIDELISKMDMRMQSEATEYARCCERYYYEQLRAMIDLKLQVLDDYQEGIKRVYNK